MSKYTLKRYLSIFRIAVMGGLVVLLNQNCFQLNQKTMSSSIDTDEALASINGKSECQFISVPTLQNMLRNTLGLPRNDTAILNSNGSPSNNMYIARNLAALGAPTADSPADPSCSALKYKLAAEIMVNACSEAPAATMQQLFPNGTSDFNALYLTFMGRAPTQEEVEILRQLVGSVSAQSAQKAACAAVGSSLEALARNI